MPLQFEARAPVEAFRQVSAAKVVYLTIDLLSKRVVGLVAYGNIVSDQFVENKNVNRKTMVIDGAAFDNLAAIIPDASKNMYDNIKELFWQAVVASGQESGTIV